MLLAPPPALLAQPTQVPLPQITPIQEEVTVVRVEVTLHVTDKQGRVVPGLKQEDFQLFVDDQPVPIESLDWEGTVSASTPHAGAAPVRADEPEVPAED